MDFFAETGVGANLKEQFENIVGSDAADAASDPVELQIKNAYSFANLRFTFPVTDPKTVLRFPAYVRSLSDNFSVGWNVEQVYGRSDPIAIYQGTSRTMSFGFAIPLFDSTDANANMQKLNRLIQNLYPTYATHGAFKKNKDEGNRVIRGAPLTRIRFANLITNPNKPGSGLLGFITSLNVEINPSNGFFIESGIVSMGALFPRIFEFSISFTPLHEETLGWKDGENGEFFGRTNDFPYLTKLRFGDVLTAGFGAVGLGTNTGFAKIFGGG